MSDEMPDPANQVSVYPCDCPTCQPTQPAKENTMNETEVCRMCPDSTVTITATGDDVALCLTHWNRWVIRYLNADDAPPCAAHLILDPVSS